MQVFVPREDLSLDVIKQYQVVSDPCHKAQVICYIVCRQQV